MSTYVLASSSLSCLRELFRLEPSFVKIHTLLNSSNNFQKQISVSIYFTAGDPVERGSFLLTRLQQIKVAVLSDKLHQCFFNALKVDKNLSESESQKRDLRFSQPLITKLLNF